MTLPEQGPFGQPEQLIHPRIERRHPQLAVLIDIKHRDTYVDIAEYINKKRLPLAHNR